MTFERIESPTRGSAEYFESLKTFLTSNVSFFFFFLLNDTDNGGFGVIFGAFYKLLSKKFDGVDKKFESLESKFDKKIGKLEVKT